MRYLLLALLFLFLPQDANAVTGFEAREGFVFAQPTWSVDAGAECNDTAVARFGFVLGQPAVVYDADANCTAVAGGGYVKRQEIIWFESD